MDSARNQLRERLVTFTEGRSPHDLGGEKCSNILYSLSAETANIATNLARSVQDARRRGGRQVLFKSEDLPLLP